MKPDVTARKFSAKEVQMTRLGMFVLLLCTFSSVIGCGDPQAFFDKFAPKEADRFARDYIELVRGKNFDRAVELLDEQVRNQSVRSQIEEVAKFLDRGNPSSVELVGFNVVKNPQGTQNNLTYQLQFTDSWLLASVVVKEAGGQKHILGFHVNPIPSSLKEMNAFALRGKTLLHYGVLVLAVAIPIFILYTLILCARTRIKRKWLWVIFILLGIGTLGLNWTTGELRFQLISFLLLGAGAFKPGLYGPWSLSIAFPLGAVLFLLKRRRLEQPQA